MTTWSPSRSWPNGARSRTWSPSVPAWRWPTPDPLPSREGRRRNENGATALRAHMGSDAPRVLRRPPAPGITLRLGAGRFVRLGSGGRVETIVHRPELDVEALAAGETALGLEMVETSLSSWPLHLERGRRGVTEAPLVVADSAKALADSCSWLDWSQALSEEDFRVVVGNRRLVRRRRATARGAAPRPARVDLSFLFEPTTRIASVTGGLMDQLTFIGSFEDLCARSGTKPWYDDLIYLWLPVHDGSVASRLDRTLDERRISRRISPTLRAVLPRDR